MSNFRLRFYLDKRYKSKNPDLVGQYHVKIRIASKVTNRYKNLPTDIYLSELEFNSLFPEYASKDYKKKSSYIERSGSIARNEDFKAIKYQLESELRKYKESETPDIITIDQLVNNLGYSENSTSLKDWFNNKAKEVKSVGGLGQYMASYMSFTAFYNGFRSGRDFSYHFNKKLPYKELSIYDITINFLNDWEDWMREGNMSIDTIAGYSKNVRAVLNLAKKKKLISDISYPFGDGKYIIKENHQRIERYLMDEDRIKLMGYTPESEMEQIAWDLWFFSYYSSGVNLVEITNMKHSQINEDLTMWWYYRRKNKRRKKQVKVEIPINKMMKEIIHKYSGSETYVFNFLDKYTTRNLNGKIDDAYKLIAKKLDFDNLCFQMARHSAFTNLNKEFTVDEMMDLGTHTKKSTLEGYIKRLNITVKQKNMYSKLQKS